MDLGTDHAEEGTSREFPADGADAVRMGLLAMSSSQDVFSEEKIAQGQALANKLCNATRFVACVKAGTVVPSRAAERAKLERLREEPAAPPAPSRAGP